MNVGSYHQQQQQLLQFNIHQHQSSLPTGSNEVDSKMNSHNIPKYPPGGVNMMGPPVAGNPGVPNMPPSVDQITNNVNKMSVQDFEHSSFPSQMMDQNKNMAPNDGLFGAKNYSEGQLSKSNLPQAPSNISNNIPNAHPTSNYQWNQSLNDNLYPNNNAVSNTSSAPFPFNDSLQVTSNNTPQRPPSQVSSFPPQKSFSPAPPNNSFPAQSTQNNSFTPNNSFIGTPPVGKSYQTLQSNSFSPAGPPNHQNNSFAGAPSSSPYSAPFSQSDSFPPSAAVPGAVTSKSSNNSFPTSHYPNEPQSAFPPGSMNSTGALMQNSMPPKANLAPTSAPFCDPKSGFPPVSRPPSSTISGPQQTSMAPKPQTFGPPSSSFVGQDTKPTFPGAPPQMNSVPLKPGGAFPPSFPPGASESPSGFPPVSGSLNNVPLKPPANSFAGPGSTSYGGGVTSQQNSFGAAKPPYGGNTFGPSQPTSFPMTGAPASFPPTQSSFPPPQFSGAGPQQPSGFPPSSAYQPLANNSYPNTNGPTPPGYPPYNQKSAFSPPYPSKGPGGPEMQPAGFGNQYGAGMPSQQQYQRKLDPDSMPNPIEVMAEDRRILGNKPFITNQVGLVPPLVTTDFVVEDEGNANPRFIRSTMYNVPSNTDMMKQADVPFSLVITPLATLPSGELSPPIVNTGDFGPVRCVRCKAYVNPYMKFVDGGRRFVCALCKAVTEVPAEYFQHLDHTGNRVDRYERPELIYGAYEFTVTKEYCKDNEIPKIPALIFIIDVSYNNVKSGMLRLLCEQMSDIVQNYLPKDETGEEGAPRMRVGFITYDSTVHFYNIKACLGQPQMMIIGDMEDVFVPLLDGFLCDPLESLTVIDSLMQQIPTMFADTRETDTILLPAIQAGLEALKAAKCAGKLLVFHSSLPSANAPGKLANREDRKLLGTDKEKTQLAPQNTTYTNLAQECVTAGCSVDLFIFNNAHIDLATIGLVSKLTGGEVFKYTYFQADVDGERFIEDVKRDTSRNIAFDAVMRVRTSTGVRPVSFYGHMHMSNTTDIELASINADKSIAVEIKHDDKLVEEDGVFIQVALLYTSCSGQRRVRLLNLALKCCSQMADLFRNCELDTIINYLSKAAVTKLQEATPRQVKEGLTMKCARILACYRRLCADPCTPGQLILPECMKLLPLYTNCLLKNDAISGASDMTVDDRWYMMQNVLIIDIPSSVNYFYPRVIPLVNIDYYSDEIPSSIRCTSCKLSSTEAYLLENGVYMFLWLGSQIPAEWLNNVFGVSNMSTAQLNIAKIPLFENIQSKRLHSLINRIQNQRRHTMKLTVLRENDKMELVFKHFLVEDGIGGASVGDNLAASSYVDFLCHIHREIRNMLS